MNRIILIVMLFMAGIASAEAEELVGSGTVNMILNYEAHSGPLIILSNMQSTIGSCQRNDYYMLPLNHKYFSQNYALILSAKMAGKSLQIVVDRSDCIEGMPRVKHVLIEN